MVFVCRLCGKDDYELLGAEIYSKEGINKALAYKIKLSLDISVYEYDPLPKYICKLCIEKLFTTFAFQESCRRTQIELRERVLAAGNFFINGTDININSEKQANNVSGLPRVVSTATLQKSTSADTGIPIALSGQQFEFNSFLRNGVLDDLAKVVNSGKPNSRNTKKSKHTNNTGTKRKSLSVNNTSEEQSSLIRPQNSLPVSNQSTVMQAVQLPQNSVLNSNQASMLQNIMSCSSGRPSVMQAVQLPQNSNQASMLQNIMSCSSGTPTHEATNPLPFFAQISPSQQDNKCESIQIVDVYSVQDPNNTSRTIPTTNTTAINNPSSCISLIPGTQTIAIPMVNSSMTAPTYITPASGSVPISFIVAQNPSKAGSWHSPTISNTLGSVTTVPGNFQNSSDVTPRNWHTPSHTMPESSVQTTTSVAEINRNTEKLINTSQPKTECISPSGAESTATAPESRTNITLDPSANTSELRLNTSSKSSGNTSELGLNTSSKSSANTSELRTNNNSESTANSASLCEDEDEDEEDDIFIVEVVKANKGSIAQHWEKYNECYRCKDCKKTFKKLVKCENHIRTHLGIRPFECKLCKRRFLKRRLLNEHSIAHTGKKLYQCKECPKAFRYRKNFKLHLEVHTEVVSRSYLCEICRKTFNSQYDYWNHKTSKHIISID